MRNQWYPVFFSHELPPGAVHGLELCGKPVVVFRTESGQLGALEDACPHRSAPLSLGRIVGESLACPYHGWQFTAEGKPSHVPTLGEEEAPPARACGTRVAVREAFNMLWLFAGRADLAPEPMAMARLEADVFGDGAWTSIEMRLDVDVHHALLTENLLDPAHINFVHHGTIAREEDAGPLEVQLEPTDDGFVFTHRNPRRSKDEPSNEMIDNRPSEGVKQATATTFVAPGAVSIGFAVSPQMAFKQVTYSVPLEANRVRLVFRAYRNFAVGDEASDARILAHSAETFDQDLTILAGLQRRLEQGYPPYANPVREDRGCVAFRRWLDGLEPELRC